MNGCIEHITILQEVIEDARIRKKDLHITWFDLQDAFGSVNHQLIPFTMKHYHFPQFIIDYISNLYKKINGRIMTKNWESNIFYFKKGLFQGDALSGPIFLTVFNPIIEELKKIRENNGYEIIVGSRSERISTTPFADDYDLISNGNSSNH